ncbi:hypothetical protein EV426DRAFT_639098 [Tirmania nivea]|nr:hypothetical protein EV426DRAFT_639098 [Tirmania nivea]
MPSYTASNRNTRLVAAKVILLVLGVFAIFITILLPCTWLQYSLSSTSLGNFRLILWAIHGKGNAGQRGARVGGQGEGGDGKRQKVQLEIHIMSKCPDARDCVEDLVFPALGKLGPGMVDFRMSFIGKTAPGNGGIICMHGPGECLGNVVHLCGAKLYPYSHAAEKQNTTFIQFSQCLIHSYEKLPDQFFIEDCAKEGKVDFQKINKCVSDQGSEGGIELLKSSFKRSEYLGIRTSCTIRLAGQRRCIRDGGKWRDCEGGSRVEDLVRDIKAEYHRGEREVDENEALEPYDERYEERYEEY